LRKKEEKKALHTMTLETSTELAGEVGKGRDEGKKYCLYILAY
jgi:hypothetical protein